MKIRQATQSDADSIREVAEQSFQASYALSPVDIETVIEVEFGGDRLTERLNDDAWIVLVAEEDDRLLGFTEGRLMEDERAEVVWHHVDPAERGQGVGTELFDQIVAELRERTATEIRATVLAQNQEGSEFFERFDFEESGRTDRELGSKQFHLDVYLKADTMREDDEYTVPETEEITVNGEPRFLDTDEEIPGDQGPFLLVFEEERREERFGFYCTNCGTFTDSVDGLGKVVCENCGNEHRADEWDASYL